MIKLENEYTPSMTLNSDIVNSIVSEIQNLISSTDTDLSDKNHHQLMDSINHIITTSLPDKTISEVLIIDGNPDPMNSYIEEVVTRSTDTTDLNIICLLSHRKIRLDLNNIDSELTDDENFHINVNCIVMPGVTNPSSVVLDVNDDTKFAFTRRFLNGSIHKIGEYGWTGDNCIDLYNEEEWDIRNDQINENLFEEVFTKKIYDNTVDMVNSFNTTRDQYKKFNMAFFNTDVQPMYSQIIKLKDGGIFMKPRRANTILFYYPDTNITKLLNIPGLSGVELHDSSELLGVCAYVPKYDRIFIGQIDGHPTYMIDTLNISIKMLQLNVAEDSVEKSYEFVYDDVLDVLHYPIIYNGMMYDTIINPITGDPYCRDDIPNYGTPSIDRSGMLCRNGVFYGPGINQIKIYDTKIGGENITSTVTLSGANPGLIIPRVFISDTELLWIANDTKNSSSTMVQCAGILNIETNEISAFTTTYNNDHTRWGEDMTVGYTTAFDKPEFYDGKWYTMMLHNRLSDRLIYLVIDVESQTANIESVGDEMIDLFNDIAGTEEGNPAKFHSKVILDDGSWFLAMEHPLSWTLEINTKYAYIKFNKTNMTMDYIKLPTLSVDSVKRYVIFNDVVYITYSQDLTEYQRYYLLTFDINTKVWTIYGDIDLLTTNGKSKEFIVRHDVNVYMFGKNSEYTKLDTMTGVVTTGKMYPNEDDLVFGFHMQSQSTGYIIMNQDMVENGVFFAFDLKTDTLCVDTTFTEAISIGTIVRRSKYDFILLREMHTTMGCKNILIMNMKYNGVIKTDKTLDHESNRDKDERQSIRQDIQSALFDNGRRLIYDSCRECVTIDLITLDWKFIGTYSIIPRSFNDGVLTKWYQWAFNLSLNYNYNKSYEVDCDILNRITTSYIDKPSKPLAIPNGPTWCNNQLSSQGFEILIISGNEADRLGEAILMLVDDPRIEIKNNISLLNG